MKEEAKGKGDVLRKLFFSVITDTFRTQYIFSLCNSISEDTFLQPIASSIYIYLDFKILLNLLSHINSS